MLGQLYLSSESEGLHALAEGFIQKMSTLTSVSLLVTTLLSDFHHDGDTSIRWHLLKSIPNGSGSQIEQLLLAEPPLSVSYEGNDWVWISDDSNDESFPMMTLIPGRSY